MTERWLHELGKLELISPSVDLMAPADRPIHIPESTPSLAGRLKVFAVVIVILATGVWTVTEALDGSVTTRPRGAAAGSGMTWPDESTTDAQRVQAKVDSGDTDSMWRTDAGAVALRYGRDVLGWSDPIAGIEATGDPDVVNIELNGPDASCSGDACDGSVRPQEVVDLTLERLVRSGDGGIWSITSASR